LTFLLILFYIEDRQAKPKEDLADCTLKKGEVKWEHIAYFIR